MFKQSRSAKRHKVDRAMKNALKRINQLCTGSENSGHLNVRYVSVCNLFD